jgi:hypothetical protein
MGERKDVYKVLVRKFGRTKHRWDDNIKMDPQEEG